MKQNLIIRASAGTGKTFSLATRFIRLMMLQNVKPQRIVALTFSRAAAQEIYTKLLDRLWCAAMSDEGAQKEKALLLQGMDDEDRARVESKGLDWSAHRFAEILREVIATQYHGAIATLDSFILKIVRSFPLEMGFQNAVEVLDEFGEKRALEECGNALVSGEDSSGEFSKSFKMVTDGRFERTCVDVLNDTLKEWRKFLIEHPQCREWTAASMKAAFGLPEKFTLPNVDALPTTDKKQGDPFKSIQVVAKSFTGQGTIFPKNKGGELMHYLFMNPNDTAYSYNTTSGATKTILCTPEQAEIIRATVRYMFDMKISHAFDVVHAKLAICKLVDKEYNASTRSRGQLTFSDFTTCQALAEEDSDRALNLENLQFRFDTRFDHWALDEFQDTSELQWLCLRRLVQEAAQPNPDRSVMAVGDLKQSIYTWRGGNDAPFKEMMEKWREFSGEIGEIVPNDISYRYEKNTADFINKVFGEENVRSIVKDNAETEPVVIRWLAKDCWMEHRPDTKNGVPKSNDYVEIVKVNPPDEGDDEGEVDDEECGTASMRMLAGSICKLVADLWAQHEAANSTDTIGILVDKNSEGAALAERLRATRIPGHDKGLPVVWEGMDGLLDAPVVRAVLELLRLAEHPQDTFAWQMVNKLFPVRAIVFPAVETAEGVSKAVSRMLTQVGLARTLKEITNSIVSSESKPDARSVMKLESLVRTAVKYEQRRDASHGVVHFIEYLGTAAGREASASSNVIRILTIHRSKGLTLDHVIVPIPENKKSGPLLKPRKHTPLSLKNEDWVIDGISENEVRLHDPLYKAWLLASTENMLEQLRKYYVALTRARKSTHVFVCGDKKFPNDVQFRDVLLRPFVNNGNPGEEREIGSQPYGSVVAKLGTMPAFGRKNAVDRKSAVAWQHAPGRELVQRRSPAAENVVAGTGSGKGLSLGALFAYKGQSASEKGTLVHERYAQIEWIEPSSPKDAEETRILNSPWAEAFLHTPSVTTLWRERAYELYLNGVWETGRFDRVVFTEEADGKHATIYDFKTHSKRADESEEAFAERVRSAAHNQMNDYRKALASLTGIPVANIRTKLLLSSTRGIVLSS